MPHDVSHGEYQQRLLLSCDIDSVLFREIRRGDSKICPESVSNIISVGSYLFDARRALLRSDPPWKFNRDKSYRSTLVHSVFMLAN